MQSENYKIMAEKTLEERLSELYEKIDHRDQFFDKDLKTLIDGIRDAREHGGSSDYTELDNKPAINGVQLSGDKTPAQLGLATANQVEVVSNKVDKLPSGYYYGKFNSVEDLPEATEKGYAYVASSDPTVFYTYLVSGAGAEWVDSGNKMVNTVDITTPKTAETELSKGEKYFASANINDRPADVVIETGVVRSLGYRVLSPNLSFAEQVNSANTIYEIKDSFDLDGGSVTIPAGSTLKFNGGSLRNGTINFDGTLIDAEKYHIFHDNLSFSGELKSSLKVEWFGAKGGTKAVDGSTLIDTLPDSTNAIQRAFTAAEQTGIKRVIFDHTAYKISNTISVPSGHFYIGTDSTVDTAYPEWAYYEKAIIHLTAKVPAFEFQAMQSMLIENIAIEGHVDIFNDIANGDNMCGFYSPTSNCSSNTIKNCTVRCCTYGIHIKMTGNKGFTLNNFYNLGLTANVVGLCIDGDTDGSVYPWYNHNKFEKCKFSKNRNVGCLIKGGRSLQTFVITNCLFEGNGTLLKSDDVADVANFTSLGTSGIYVDASGEIEVTSCYFEGNRTTDATLLLKDLSSKEANIVTRRAILHLSNNLFAFAYQIVSLIQFGGVISTYNQFFYSAQARGEDSFVTIWDIANYGGHIVLNINERDVKTSNVYKLSKFFNPTSLQNSLVTSNIQINVPGFTPIIKPKTACPSTSTLYLDTNGSEYNTGLMPIEPIKTIESDGYGTRFDRCRELNIVLKSDMDGSAITHGYVADLVKFSSYDNSVKQKVTVSSRIIHSTSTSKFVFSNLIFDISLPNGNYFGIFAEDAQFKNCEFRFSTASWLFGCNKNLIFENCSFTNNSGSTSNVIIYPYSGLTNTVQFKNCTNDNLLKVADKFHIQNVNVNKKNYTGIGYKDDYPLFWREFGLSNLDGSRYNTKRIVDVNPTSAPSISDITPLFNESGVKIYKVVREINLKGGTLNFSAQGIILDLSDGGKFTNGTVNLNYTRVLPDGLRMDNYFSAYSGNFAPGQIITDGSVMKVLRSTNQSSWESLNTTKGTTRPTNPPIGHPHFDTTLGKPIYWNGSAWIDGNGDYIVDNSGTLQNRLALTSPVKGQQFKLTGGANDVYLIYGDYGWLKAADGTPWSDDTGTLNAMYDKYNYTLLTEEPSNWATAYNTYYKIVDNVYTKLTTLETWAEDTYYKKDENVNKGIQVKLTDTDAELLNKVVKWNGTKYINIVDNVALKAGTPTITFTTENNTTTATITSTSSGKLYYTKNGNDPTSSSTEYSSAITLADGDQVKAICVRDHIDNSAIGFVKVATPVITFSSAGILTITCDTPDVKIYYTIDGSEPSTSSTEYDSSTSVTIAKNVTVKAFAVLIGRVNSEIASEKRS